MAYLNSEVAAMDMQAKVAHFIKENQMITAGDKIVIGVSGGADSICLFHIMRHLQKFKAFSLAVVHINHGLRGEAATADEHFVKGLCERYGICYQVFKVDVKSEARTRVMSIEEAGRVIRRQALERFANENGFSLIALGHHIEDQAETVLFNLARGSAVSGLCGIHPLRGRYIRPLLCITRQEIEDYLIAQGFGWRVDQSNLTDDYTRNKIRHNTLKYLKMEVNQRASEHIASTAMQLQEVENYLLKQTQQALEKYTKIEAESIFINQQLMSEDMIIRRYLLRECVKRLTGSLKDLSKEHIESMVAVFDKAVGKRIDIIKGISIKRTYEGVVVTLATMMAPRQILPEITLPIPGECQVGEYTIICRLIGVKGEIIEGKTYTKWFDYDKIKNTLVIRSRRPGDVIATYAGGGGKKLKDYLIDVKIPREDRDALLLLTMGSQVLWIVGDRISEEYKVTSDTKQILTIQMKGRNENE